MTQRIPPQAIDMEIAVLGAIMLDPSALLKVINILTPQQFYSNKHAIIYDAILKLYAKSEPYDLLTVTQELKKLRKMETIGGATYLGEILASVPTAVNAKHHAVVVQEKSQLRSLIQKTANANEDCYSAAADVHNVATDLQDEIFSIMSARHTSEFQPISIPANQAAENIAMYHRDKKSAYGIRSGFDDLDEVTAGFFKQEVTILGGRPSMGKTSLALNIAKNASVAGRKVAIQSVEMSSIQLAMRILCSEARAPYHTARKGKLNHLQLAEIETKKSEVAAMGIFVDDTPGLSILEMQTKAKMIKAKEDIDLLIIDYLQIMKQPPQARSRNEGITEISSAARNLAKELDIAILLLSQLRRGSEDRRDKRPGLADLRDSGAIEQDADVVMFVHRPEKYRIKTIKVSDSKKIDSKGVAVIIVDKNRNGPIKDIYLQFDDKAMKFNPLAMDSTKESQSNSSVPVEEEIPF